MILATSRRVRVFAFSRPADLRKGYNGLHGIITTAMGGDVMSGVTDQRRRDDSSSRSGPTGDMLPPPSTQDQTRSN